MPEMQKRQSPRSADALECRPALAPAYGGPEPLGDVSAVLVSVLLGWLVPGPPAYS